MSCEANGTQWMRVCERTLELDVEKQKIVEGEVLLSSQGDVLVLLR